MELDIDVKKAKEVLKHASKKQTSMLFHAILDYAETGKLPKAKANDLYTAWLEDVFPRVVIARSEAST